MGHILFTLIIYPIYTLIGCIYTLFSRFTGNIGFCIIGVSIGITLFCLPLYAVAEHWQEIERDKQKAMKNGLDRIKKAFTGDERYMMTTTFYKQNNYNPIMSLRSSFGLLIQVPFFLAAYIFLSHLSALQGRSFLFIKDMGVPDSFFSIGNFQINVLPIAMTTINIISGLIYTRGFPIKDKLIPMIMALVFLVVLYPSPSGLVVYWTFNNIFSLVKNVFYKLKNPIKAFWITVCITLLAASIPVLILTTTKWKYKAIYIFIVAIVLLLPWIVKIITKLLDSYLSPIVNDSKRRVSIYLSSCVVLFLLIGLAIPSSLVSSSPIEFSNIGSHPNPIYYITNTTLQSAGIFLFWATTIFFLFNAKVQTILTIFMSGMAICGVLDTYIFMLPYGDISSSLSFLGSNTNFKTVSFFSMLNLFVSAVIFVIVAMIIASKRSKIISGIAIVLNISFIAISFLNITSISKTYTLSKSSENRSEVSKLTSVFHLSKNQPNVVVFMLDRAAGKYIETAFNEDKALKDIYSGFIHYNNVISFNSHTLQGSPGLFGGYEYTPFEINQKKEKTLREKQNEALLLIPRILTEQAGFTAVFSDPSWANYSDYMDLSIFAPYEKIKGEQLAGQLSTLWYSEHNGGDSLDNSESILKRNLLFFGFFRAAPVFVRELIYKKGSYWNPNEDVNSAKTIMDWYPALDYLPNLTDFSETDHGTYNAIVNEFTHESFFLQAPDYTPVSNVSDFGTSEFAEDAGYHTVISSLKRIGKWIAFLKENNIYDNTRIILVSDHGSTGEDKYMDNSPKLDSLVTGGKYTGRGVYHPLLMVKDFYATGEEQIDSETFMTNADVASIVLKGIVDNPVNPFTGNTIPLDTSKIKENGVIISVNDKHVPLDHSKNTYNILPTQWWHVKNNVFKSENWTQVNPFAEEKK